MEDLDLLKGDERIVEEARQRFHRCQEWEATARVRFIEDVKFANGDSDNGYQWPNDLQKARIDQDKPTLTINKTAQHNGIIINESKQNKAAGKVRPVGDGATFESAEILESLIRHTEYISNAQDAYDNGTVYQVEGGIGYWRIIADYEDEDSFDQELYIRPIRNSLSVYLDPDINEKDGSDARFGFIFDDIPRDEFEIEHPEFKNETPSPALEAEDTWVNDKHVRVAEYYRKSQKKDTLLAYVDKDGTQHTARKSKLPPEIVEALLEDPKTQKRPIISDVVEWFKIAGDKIVDRRTGKDCWPGRYIPIMRIIGKETVIDGQLDRKGHTRALKDPQRMYNYNSSASVEYGALQTKAPWTAPAAAIEEFTQIWENANTKNYSILPYNHMDDDGNPIPPPQRIAPPQGAQFYVEERNSCAQDMMMVSGQYQDSLGQQSNAVSGKAIGQRERQGDKATYHFIDNQAVAIRFTCKVLLDLYPHFYDTKRVKKILAEDGTEREITIDPQAKQAYEQKQQQENEVIAGIFNPSIGKYDVQADVGPSYGTNRQEAFAAYSQMITQNPEIGHIIGDLALRYADFPGADEAAERLKRMVPPQALGTGPSPQDAKVQEQMQKTTKALQDALTELATEKLKYKGKEQQKDIDVYKALTDRMDTLLKHVVVTPKDNASMLHDVMTIEHQSNLDMVHDTALQGMQNEEQSSDTQAD